MWLKRRVTGLPSPVLCCAVRAITIRQLPNRPPSLPFSSYHSRIPTSHLQLSRGPLSTHIHTHIPCLVDQSASSPPAVRWAPVLSCFLQALRPGHHLHLHLHRTRLAFTLSPASIPRIRSWNCPALHALSQLLSPRKRSPMRMIPFRSRVARITWS